MADALGLVPSERRQVIHEQAQAITQEVARLHTTHADGITLAQQLKRPGATYATLPGRRNDLAPSVMEQVEFELKYQGYIEREWRQIEKAEQMAKQKIPATCDFHAIHALRYESREKLSTIRPADLGQAGRISGITPADIAILSVWLKKQSRY